MVTAITLNACLDVSGLGKEFEQSEAKEFKPQPLRQKVPVAQACTAHNPTQASNSKRRQPALHVQEPQRPQSRPLHRFNTTYAVPDSKRNASEQGFQPKAKVQLRPTTPFLICNSPTPRSKLDRHTSVRLGASLLEFSEIIKNLFLS